MSATLQKLLPAALPKRNGSSSPQTASAQIHHCIYASLYNLTTAHSTDLNAMLFKWLTILLRRMVGLDIWAFAVTMTYAIHVIFSPHRHDSECS